VKELIQDLNIHIKALGFLREWNMIAFVLISYCFVNKCNFFSTFYISGVVLPRIQNATSDQDALKVQYHNILFRASDPKKMMNSIIRLRFK